MKHGSSRSFRRECSKLSTSFLLRPTRWTRPKLTWNACPSTPFSLLRRLFANSSRADGARLLTRTVTVRSSCYGNGICALSSRSSDTCTDCRAKSSGRHTDRSCVGLDTCTRHYVLVRRVWVSRVQLLCGSWSRPVVEKPSGPVSLQE